VARPPPPSITWPTSSAHARTGRPTCRTSRLPRAHRPGDRRASRYPSNSASSSSISIASKYNDTCHLAGWQAARARDPRAVRTVDFACGGEEFAIVPQIDAAALAIAERIRENVKRCPAWRRQ
jgi:hypothetical protein